MQEEDVKKARLAGMSKGTARQGATSEGSAAPTGGHCQTAGARALHGLQEQSRILRRFRAGQLNLLISTSGARSGDAWFER